MHGCQIYVTHCDHITGVRPETPLAQFGKFNIFHKSILFLPIIDQSKVLKMAKLTAEQMSFLESSEKS